MNTKKAIVLFDGICKLCNFWVDFLLKRDRDQQFSLVSFQSTKGKELIERYKIVGATDSVVMIAGDHIYFESEAVIRISAYLNIPWKWLCLFRLIPLKMRNIIYRWIAKNRYKWFGKRKSCRIV